MADSIFGMFSQQIIGYIIFFLIVFAIGYYIYNYLSGYINGLMDIVKGVIPNLTELPQKVITGALDLTDDVFKTLTSADIDNINKLSLSKLLGNVLPEVAYCPKEYESNRTTAAKALRTTEVTALSTLSPLLFLGPLAPYVSLMLVSKQEYCKKCPDGYESDGVGNCYKECPKDWKGGDTLAFCLHNMYYSTVGTKGAMESVCPSSHPTKYSGLCYKLPDDSWVVTSPGYIGKDCDKLLKGSKSDGLGNCVISSDSFSRGAGVSGGIGQGEDNCEDKYGVSCEKKGLLWYPKCAAYAKKLGKSNSEDYEQGDTVNFCKKPSIKKDRQTKASTGVSTILDCPSDKEKHGLLCYPKCKDGYYRSDSNLEYCMNKCPDEYNDIGIGGCKKPSADVTKVKLSEVGVCSDTAFPIKDQALCWSKAFSGVINGSTSKK